MVPDSDQFEFTFPTVAQEPLFDAAPWREEWLRRAEQLCRRLGVPLNHQAEVRLAQGPVLRGKLSLAEEQLWHDEGDRHRIVLRIDHTPFSLGDVEAVLRLD